MLPQQGQRQWSARLYTCALACQMSPHIAHGLSFVGGMPWHECNVNIVFAGHKILCRTVACVRIRMSTAGKVCIPHVLKKNSRGCPLLTS